MAQNIRSHKKPSESVNKNAYTMNIPRSISTLHDKHPMDETAIWPKILRSHKNGA